MPLVLHAERVDLCCVVRSRCGRRADARGLVAGRWLCIAIAWRRGRLGSPVRAEGRDRLRGEARYLLILVVRDHHGIRSWPPATDDAMPASSAASRLASAMPDGLQIGNPVDLTFKVSTTQPAAPTDIGGDYSLLT